jgi:DNA-binding transcriptional LysR family regulator
MDELASIRIFVRVVACGGFAAAARQLGLSKSVITKRIGHLEHRLRTELFVRLSRKVSLTEAGASYFERCARIVAEVEEAEAAVRGMTTSLNGVLRITCMGSFLAARICGDACRFQKLHPELTIELHHNDRSYDPIHEGYDICLQTSDIAGENILRKPVVELKRALVATPAFLRRYGVPGHPDALAEYRWTHNNIVLPLQNLLFESRTGIHRAPPLKPVIMTNNIWTLREAAVSGDCMGILPLFFITEDLRRGTLVPVLGDYRVPPAMVRA